MNMLFQSLCCLLFWTAVFTAPDNVKLRVAWAAFYSTPFVITAILLVPELRRR